MPSRSFPGVDDRLVVPVVTRDEMIGGRRVVASPADRPHARQHGKLSVLNFHVAPGYSFAVDQLTRHDEESDFASDACIYKEGIDPATGTRYLEEIAFEVQRYGSLTTEARSKVEAISSVEELTGLASRALAGASLMPVGAALVAALPPGHPQGVPLHRD